ncbi:hypothetical protein BGW80DRAFT_71953 [Lactifluus volemus]|nr:hypothetical protein BGW80DRAFT_71953 [Lactifluus volemus]
MQRPVTSKSRGICRYYNTPRGCFAGDSCKFLHGEHEKLTPYDKNKTCRYFAAGYCKRGEKCWFRHVTPANTTTANTSEPPICAICMEVPVTFGLLVDCSHVFCIDCIRMWRGQGNSSDDLSLTHMHKTCPYCRISSKYVIPSSHFYPSGHPGKAHIIEQYKESLQRVSCKYFAASNPENRFCPFGRDCLYQHLNEDGTRYVFERGADYYMLQRDRHLPGFRDSRSFREVLNRSIYGWLPMDSIFGIPELVPDEFASDVDWALERTDTESESDGPAHLEGPFY